MTMIEIYDTRPKSEVENLGREFLWEIKGIQKDPCILGI